MIERHIVRIASYIRAGHSFVNNKMASPKVAMYYSYKFIATVYCA